MGSLLTRPTANRRRSWTALGVLALFVAAIAAPSSQAKGRIAVALGDSTPRSGQAFTVYVRTDFVVPADDWIRLVAVAPGRDWYDVVGTVTGDSSLAHAKIPRDGFEIALSRVGPRNWRAAVRLPQPGRWRLVVPNGTHAGFMVPPPSSWMPWVRVRP